MWCQAPATSLHCEEKLNMWGVSLRPPLLLPCWVWDAGFLVHTEEGVATQGLGQRQETS